MKKEEVIIRVQTELRESAESFWFRGQTAFDKSNKSRGEYFHKRYNELHDLIMEVDKLR